MQSNPIAILKKYSSRHSLNAVPTPFTNSSAIPYQVTSDIPCCHYRKIVLAIQRATPGPPALLTY